MAENTVDIVIRGRDEASAEIRRVYTEMKSLGEITDESRGRMAAAGETIREQNRVLRLISTSSRVQYSDAILVANSLSRVGAIASHVTGMLNSYNVAAIRVTEAQRDYREAVKESGPASEEAIAALSRLKAAQDAQRMTMISLMAQIPGLVAQFISLTVSLQAAGFAARTLWASLIPVVGIAAVAITAGAAIWGASQSSRIPSGQTLPGQLAQITRTGLMVGHEGEWMGRGVGGINVSGPLMSIGRIEMNPEGESVESISRRLGRQIQDSLRAKTVAYPL